MSWIRFVFRSLFLMLLSTFLGVLGNLAAAIIEGTFFEVTTTTVIFTIIGMVLAVIAFVIFEQWPRREVGEMLDELEKHRSKLRNLRSEHQRGAIWTSVLNKEWQENKTYIENIKSRLREKNAHIPYDDIDSYPEPQVKFTVRLLEAIKRYALFLVLPFVFLFIIDTTPTIHGAFLRIAPHLLPDVEIHFPTPVATVPIPAQATIAQSPTSTQELELQNRTPTSSVVRAENTTDSTPEPTLSTGETPTFIVEATLTITSTPPSDSSPLPLNTVTPSSTPTIAPTQSFINVDGNYYAQVRITDSRGINPTQKRIFSPEEDVYLRGTWNGENGPGMAFVDEWGIQVLYPDGNVEYHSSNVDCNIEGCHFFVIKRYPILGTYRAAIVYFDDTDGWTFANQGLLYFEIINVSEQ